MARVFAQLCESMTRYVYGGFLTGDNVKFTSNALHDKFLQTCTPEYAEQIKKLIDSGLNLRVQNIKSTMPAVMGAGNPDYNGVSFNVEVAQELAPGMYDRNQSITVPASILERIDTGINLSPVPDRVKRQETIVIKPESTAKSEDNEVPFYSPKQTRISYGKNNKPISGDRDLLNKNVVIPNITPKGHRDPASYTANYLPKK